MQALAFRPVISSAMRPVSGTRTGHSLATSIKLPGRGIGLRRDRVSSRLVTRSTSAHAVRSDAIIFVRNWRANPRNSGDTVGAICMLPHYRSNAGRHHSIIWRRQLPNQRTLSDYVEPNPDDELSRSRREQMHEAAQVKLARAAIDLALDRLTPRMGVVLANVVGSPSWRGSRATSGRAIWHWPR
jgi:hypothetical protein